MNEVVMIFGGFNNINNIVKKFHSTVLSEKYFSKGLAEDQNLFQYSVDIQSSKTSRHI